MDLSDAGGSEGSGLDVVEVVVESGRCEFLEERLGILFRDGRCPTVQTLEFNAPLRFDQIRTEGEDLAKFDRKQPHRLDGFNINRFFPSELPEKPDES
jgi:hypothetical protein